MAPVVLFLSVTDLGGKRNGKRRGEKEANIKAEADLSFVREAFKINTKEEKKEEEKWRKTRGQGI